MVNELHCLKPHSSFYNLLIATTKYLIRLRISSDLLVLIS